MAFSLSKTILRQNWLFPAESVLQRGVGVALNRLGPQREAVENALLGTRLGHPVHVMLTDIPIGAWTAAMALDAWAALQKQPGERELWERAARGTIAVGVVGALGAAVTGLAEFGYLRPPTRRLALVHGLINIAGTALFATSLARRRQPGRGHRSALAGYACMLAAARLGGDLVYRHGVRVDTAEAATATLSGRVA